MASCFPITKYVYFIVIYIVGFFILYYRPDDSQFTFIGYSVLLTSSIRFFLYIVNDIITFLTSVNKYKIGAISLFISSILFIVSNLLMVLTMSWSHYIFAISDEPPHLSPHYTAILNKFKDFSLVEVLLLFGITVLAFSHEHVILKYVENITASLGSNKMMPMRIVFGIIGFAVLVSISSRDDLLNNKEIYNLFNAGKIICLSPFIYFLSTALHSTFEYIDIVSYGMPYIINTLIVIINSILLIYMESKYDDLKNTDPKIYIDAQQYFVTFLVFLSIFTFSLFTSFSFSSTILTKLFRYGIPLTSIAISSYLVYLSNDLFSTYSQLRIK